MNFITFKKRWVFLLGIMFITLTAHGQWVDVGNSKQDINGLGEFQKDIEINPFTGYPVVAYCDYASSRLMVKEYDGVKWNDVGDSRTALEGNGEDYFDLAVNPLDGTLYIIYSVARKDSVAVMQYDGNNWKDVGESIKSLNSRSNRYVLLKVHPVTGNPYISYQNNSIDTPKFKYYDGISWLTVGSESAFEFNNISHIYDFTFHPITKLPYVLTGVNSFVVKAYNGAEWEKVGNSITGKDAFYNKGKINFHPFTNEPYILISGTNLGQYNYFAHYIGRMEWQSDFQTTAITTPPTNANDINFYFNSISTKRIVAGEYQSRVGVFIEKSERWIELGNSVEEIDGLTTSSYSNDLDFILSPLNNHPFIIYSDANSDKLMVKEYICSTSSEISIGACDYYTSPSGKYVWETSGTYQDTIPNKEGCDSIITINLIVYEASNSELNISSCGPYTTPSGKIIESTGLYYDTLTNALGCDSIIALDVLIVEPSYSNFIMAVCDSLVSPSGKYTWRTSGNYTDTLLSVQGCDSIVTYDLTVNKTSYTDFVITACETFVSPSGKHALLASGTLIDTLTSSSGCDSILFFDVTITQPVEVYDTVTYMVCDSLFEDVSPKIYFDNTYQYQTIFGCDSTVHTYEQYVYAANVYTDTLFVSVEDTLHIEWTNTSFGNVMELVKVLVHPNPTHDKINIEVEDYDKITEYQISIYDITGKMVWNSAMDMKNMSVDLSTLGSKGVYLLNIVDGNGHSIANRKIVLK